MTHPAVLSPPRGLPGTAWEAAVALLRGADEVALACHVNPDGDALGSMLALGQALRVLGKRVVCSWSGDTMVPPPAYAELPGLELLTDPAEFPREPRVFVTLDTASIDRLGSLGPLVDTATDVLVVDHHASNDGFGSVRLIDSAAAATAVLVAELIHRLGVPLSPEIAACLYTGVTTDTGSFKYAATTPAVHRLAARLLETGIRHDIISRTIWDTNSFGYVQLLGTALRRAGLKPTAAGGLGLVWTYTTVEELRGFGVGLDEIEGIIDVIRTTAEAEVAVICKGDVDGTLKVSLRSKGRVDVGAVCVALGGGGHRFAAGFTAHGDVPGTVERIRAELATAPHLPE